MAENSLISRLLGGGGKTASRAELGKDCFGNSLIERHLDVEGFTSKYERAVAKSGLVRRSISKSRYCLPCHPELVSISENITRRDDVHERSILKSGLARRAFTLAEVLITLGIIGVVAAMTLPTVIHKYQAKSLESGFKKAYANLQNAYNLTKSSLGDVNIRSTYAAYDAQLKRYPRTSEFLDEFYKNYKVVKAVNSYAYLSYSGVKMNAAIAANSNDYPKATRILPDGSSVGSAITTSRIQFWIDTNGPYKGPNRYGFDIFEFWVNDNTDKIKPIKQIKKYSEEELESESYPGISGNPCNKESSQKGNGMGCSWYAVNNVDPEDDTKDYWNNLPW